MGKINPLKKLSSLPENFSLTFRFLLFVCIIGSYFAPATFAQKAETGSLIVYFNGESAILSPFDNEDNYKMIEPGDTLNYKPGLHSLTISYPNSYDRTFAVDIKKDKIHKYTFDNKSIDNKIEANYYEESSYDYLLKQVNTIIVTDQDALIYVDGKKRGMGVAALNLQKSMVSIKASLPFEDFSSEWRHSIDPASKNYFQHIIRPDKKTLYKKSLIPGLAHLYKHEKQKGVLILAGLSVTTTATVAFISSYRNQMDSYNAIYAQYKSETDEILATTLGNKLRTKDSEISKTRNLIYTTSALSIGIYLYSIIDGISAPEMGFRESNDDYLNLHIDSDMVGIKGKIGF